MSTHAACQEARDAVAYLLADPLAQARVAAHRSRCAACRAYAGHVATTADAVRAAAGPGLDDLARARVTARLALAIDELATRNSQRAQHRGPVVWRSVLAGAGVAAAAAVLLGLTWHRQSVPMRPGETAVAITRPPAVPAPIPIKQPPAPPRTAASGGDSAAAAKIMAGRLTVPAGTTVRTFADRYTRLTIVGPAQLVVEAVAPQLSLRLESGLLLGEYEHHPGGTLLVHSPGATTTVVGTVFAVEATASGTSRVAVRRGAVLVHSDTETVRLGAGWSWASGESARPRIPTPLDEQLAAHATAGTVLDAKVIPLRSKSGVLPSQSGSTEAAVATRDAAAASSPPLNPALPPEAEIASRVSPPIASKGPQPESVPPPVTADSLYKEAEAAMRAGDRSAVRASLMEVIRRFPKDGLADAALYELARREQADGRAAQARSYLDQLLTHGGEKELREPARYLRCRLELGSGRDAVAITCLAAFRKEFPTSAHDAEVLALLIGLHQAHSDCSSALPLLDEYARRYPSGPLDVGARRTRCRP